MLFRTVNALALDDLNLDWLRSIGIVLANDDSVSILKLNLNVVLLLFAIIQVDIESWNDVLLRLRGL